MKRVAFLISLCFNRHGVDRAVRVGLVFLLGDFFPNTSSVHSGEGSRSRMSLDVDLNSTDRRSLSKVELDLQLGRPFP